MEGHPEVFRFRQDNLRNASITQINESIAFYRMSQKFE